MKNRIPFHQSFLWIVLFFFSCLLVKTIVAMLGPMNVHQSSVVWSVFSDMGNFDGATRNVLSASFFIPDDERTSSSFTSSSILVPQRGGRHSPSVEPISYEQSASFTSVQERKQTPYTHFSMERTTRINAAGDEDDDDNENDENDEDVAVPSLAPHIRVDCVPYMNKRRRAASRRRDLWCATSPPLPQTFLRRQKNKSEKLLHPRTCAFIHTWMMMMMTFFTDVAFFFCV